MISDPYSLHGTELELNVIIHKKIKRQIGPSGSVN